MIQFADTQARRPERIADAIRAIKERVHDQERLSDCLYAEMAERFSTLLLCRSRRSGLTLLPVDAVLRRR